MLKILQKTKPPFKFQYTSRCMENVKGVKWIVCNSFYKVESSTYDSFPDILPIGPLFSSGHHREPTSFWTEDETTLEWLTQQRECSVIHVSFGSFTLFDKHQFQELYLALESLGRPFLWAARPGLVDKSEAAYPKGFLDRVGVLVPTKGGVNENGIFSTNEIRRKVEEVLGDDAMRHRFRNSRSKPFRVPLRDLL
ncbi:hypothetical protein AMTR_s00110p00119750 [Amborella trichopoda]|uniref:Uncharacterized protein n=1 Tax=Amborella trichopoda TaxID=13333 RepID=W1NWG0_AMBTC|nr:hypothetical protein AMTR_s00110p00119750 [Amborella trichopoda]